jgi:hypothetical protein
MVATAKKPKITGQELAALWDDYQAKRRRWKQSFPKGYGLDNPLTNGYLTEAQSAFDAAYSAMLGAAGCKKNSAACMVTLPDGRTLVSIPNDLDQIGDEWAQLHCVEVGSAVKLS